MDKLPWVGASVKRKEDDRLLRGSGRFLDDVEETLTLHVAIGRCPYPHARIRSIDVTRALAHSGVEAVLTGPQLVARTEGITALRPFPGSAPTMFYGMAHEVARYEGEPVVAVAAVDRYVAEDALELIDIDYEPLPHVVTVEDALRPGAPQLHATVPANVVVESSVRAGEPDRRLADAAVTVEGTFHINRVSGAPIETRGVIARWAEDTDTLELWSSTQTPHLLRAQLAHCLRMDETDVRVIAPDVGGAFGLKIGVYPEDIIAALLAIDTGRPVKWIEDRTEFFRGAAHAREAVHTLTLAADRDGTLCAMRDRYLIDLGAYHGPLGPPLLTNVMLAGPYRLHDADIHRRVVLTNKVPMGAYRGYGQAESNYVREVLVDRLARRLGRDPADVRRRNLLR
ncbi:MAG TPA: xanthine dehydrogenase family protein molybdopterin-binding subunit, partial [Methylomirabilota bacterium]|nr:xanthine dehydrogenase family protein molybdopterin-binding subunit [Methylomirabilota bacterium]